MQRGHTGDTKTKLEVLVVMSQVILFLLPEIRRKLGVMHAGKKIMLEIRKRGGEK